MNREFKSGDIICDFKRQYLTEVHKKQNVFLYKVITIAVDTETNKQMLVYQALYRPFEVLVCPLSKALEESPKDKYPNAKQKYRFELYIKEE